jgi:hypothetical protein
MREKAWVLVCLFFVLLFNPSFSLSQSANSISDNSNAGNLVSVLLSRTGWNNVPIDATAVGTVRDAATPADQGAPIKIQARGRAQLRYEVTLEGSTAVTVVDGAKAARISNGTTKGLPSHAALSMRVPIFPFMDALAGIGTSKTVQYVGTEKLDAAITDVIDIVPTNLKNDPERAKRNPNRFRLWIARDTGLLLQISFERLAISNPLAATTYIRRYSDYRLVNGRLFPFHQEQALQGNSFDIVIDFTNVEFDTGLTDSTFDVPTTAEVQR